jgi:hypothetical protein
LGEDVRGCGIGLEETDSVLLVEQEVEVADGVGLGGVELALTGDRAKAGEDEVLRALGEELCGGESAQTGEEESERERCLRHYEV